jgi:hypothetical protein
LPHSEIPGSKRACRSPRLIAACRVLHRLLSPRHPSCALCSLTTKKSIRIDCLSRFSTAMGPARAPALTGEADPAYCVVWHASRLYLPRPGRPAVRSRCRDRTLRACGRVACRTHPFKIFRSNACAVVKEPSGHGSQTRPCSVDLRAGWPCSGLTPASGLPWRTDGTPRVPEKPRLRGVCPETCLRPPGSVRDALGGRAWSRTRDLVLIRDAL